MTVYCHDLDSAHIFGPDGTCVNCPQKARQRAAEAAPAALQCRWYGGTTHPEENARCKRPAKPRAWNVILCDRHNEMMYTDPEDWDDEEEEDDA